MLLREVGLCTWGVVGDFWGWNCKGGENAGVGPEISVKFPVGGNLETGRQKYSEMIVETGGFGGGRRREKVVGHGGHNWGPMDAQ